MRRVTLALIVSAAAVAGCERRTTEETKPDVPGSKDAGRNEVASIDLTNEDRRIRAYDAAFVKEQITRNPDYRQLRQIGYWCRRNRATIIPWLIEKLEDRTFAGLNNYADLTIPAREVLGDMRYHGHGPEVRDDLFTVAGRASFLLKESTGKGFDDQLRKRVLEDFGVVRPVGQLAHSTGLWFIALLLRKPEQSLSAWDLTRVISRTPRTARSLHAPDAVDDDVADVVRPPQPGVVARPSPANTG